MTGSTAWQVSQNPYKVYVSVTAEFSSDGILKPLKFRWEDGREYEIQAVRDIRRAASLKAGGVGYRYECLVYGHWTYLYYEENNRWFMERRNN